MKKISLSLVVAALMQVSSPAIAKHHSGGGLFDFSDKDRWIMRARLISIDPDESSDVTGISAEVVVDAAVVPELDFTYFLTDYIAAEVILATAKHDVSTNTGIDLGDVWILPPHLLLQYHLNPQGKFRPYLGAGIGYIFYYGEGSGDASNIDYDNNVSYALQAGFDYEIDRKWAFNADVKKLYHTTDLSVSDGAVTAKVDLDPCIFGVGAAYRF